MADISLEVSYLRGASFGRDTRNRIISAITKIQEDLEAFKQAFDVEAEELIDILSAYRSGYSSTYYADLLNYMKTVASSAYYGNSRIAKAWFSNASSVGSYAFNQCTNLSTVSMPICTTIGNGAFSGAVNLTDAYFPIASVVETGAFVGCIKLSNLNLESVETIGFAAFADCDRLSQVSFPAATVIEDYAFGGCGELTDVNLPAFSGSITESMFYRCFQLYTISAPLVTEIASSAFTSCNLVSADFPSVTSIGNNAFNGCSSLKSVNLPLATSIGWYAFAECSSLESIILPSATSIGWCTFDSCAVLSVVRLPAMTEFDLTKFRRCPRLTTFWLDVASTATLHTDDDITGEVVSDLYFGSTAVLGFYGFPWLPQLPRLRTSGHVHVRASLVEAYKTASGWSSVWQSVSSTNPSFFVGDYDA